VHQVGAVARAPEAAVEHDDDRARVVGLAHLDDVVRVRSVTHASSRNTRVRRRAIFEWMLRVVAVFAFALGLAPAAAAAPLSVAAAVEPGSHAAAFRWTSSVPAITTVEVGRNDVFGIWLRTPKQPRADGRALL